MAKGKKAAGVPNGHLYSRVSFLYQAAALLETSTSGLAEKVSREGLEPGADKKICTKQSVVEPQLRGMSRQLLTALRSVSKKSSMRLSQDMKRTICRRCDTLLIEGRTLNSTIENKSRGEKKTWADMLVMKCSVCGNEKRFPVNAPRPARKTKRIEDDCHGTSR
jgi:ribonuclease P protein subunit RPR2